LLGEIYTLFKIELVDFSPRKGFFRLFVVSMQILCIILLKFLLKSFIPTTEIVILIYEVITVSS